MLYRYKLTICSSGVYPIVYDYKYNILSNNGYRYVFRSNSKYETRIWLDQHDLRMKGCKQIILNKLNNGMSIGFVVDIDLI